MPCFIWAMLATDQQVMKDTAVPREGLWAQENKWGSPEKLFLGKPICSFLGTGILVPPHGSYPRLH